MATAVPATGYVLINEFGRHECSASQKKTAADLYNLVSAPVTSTAEPGGSGFCDGDDPAPQVVAAFDGPVSESGVLAAYRRHAAEVGWREGLETGTSWACFDGALPDGTPFKVELWSDEKLTGGGLSRYFVTGSYLGPNTPTSTTVRCGETR